MKMFLQNPVGTLGMEKNMMKLEIDNDQTQLPSLTRQDTRLTFASHQHRKTHSSLWINNFCCLYWVQHNSFLISSSSQNESSKGNSMWQLCDFHFVHRGGLGTGQCRYLVSNIFSYYMTTLRGMGLGWTKKEWRDCQISIYIAEPSGSYSDR